jgi:outer membrane protein
MKKFMVISALLIATASTVFSQKYAFVDTEYILGNIPSYRAAQEQIDKFSADWQAEVEKKFDDIEKMYNDFQAEKILLTEELKKKRENEIIKKEKEARELQKKYFGPEGDLFKKREELIKPIQDELYNAVKEIALEGNFAVIFDTSSGPSILFSDPKHDKSDDVLQKLGYKN